MLSTFLPSVAVGSITSSLSHCGVLKQVLLDGLMCKGGKDEKGCDEIYKMPNVGCVSLP